MAQILLSKGPAPATPPTGYSTIYIKADGVGYSKTDTGVETQFVGVPGPTGPQGIQGITGSAPVINGTSLTSLLIGVGSKTYTTQAGCAWITGDWIITSSQANSANYMSGQVTSYSGTSLILNIVTVGGSGTFADWNIGLSGVKGADGTGSGTVASVSVVSANGFAGTVATPTTTPAITLSTGVTGVLKGNGTAISAAVLGTDYINSVAFTNTLWVSKNGNDTNAGTLSAPFLTVGAANTAAASGTTIMVMPGTYTENLTLKAGVSIQGQQARTSIITGNMGAAYSGTTYLHSVDLQASSGNVLTISGANATNLQLDDCHIDGLSGSSDTVSYTNTNASSAFNADNGVITQAVSTTARVIKCAATAAGTIYFEDVSTKLLDNPNNVALEVAGAVSFTHNGDQVQGTISVANTAIYNGVNLKLIATSVASLTTNSASATPSTLTNVIHYSSANPLVTGAGLFAQGLNVFAGTGSNFNVTLSGGAGALPLPASMFQLHSSTLAPAGGLAAGYYDGALEYDGTNLYIDVGTSRKTIVVNGGALGTPLSGTLTSCTGLPAAGVVGTAAILGANTFTAAQNFSRATVASHATTADIWGAAGNQINWTGTATTTIFPNAPQAGAERVLICAGACSFTAGANMLIDGVASAATVTCAANDQVIVRAVSTTQFKLSRVKYDGTAQVAASVGVGDHAIEVTTGNGYGSANTKIRCFTTTRLSVGTDITYASSAVNGDSFTINTTAIYSIAYIDAGPGLDVLGISINSTELSTNYASITVANRLVSSYLVSGMTSGVFKLTAGDVIRPHTDGVMNSTSVWASSFTIRKVNTI